MHIYSRYSKTNLISSCCWNSLHWSGQFNTFTPCNFKTKFTFTAMKVMVVITIYHDAKIYRHFSWFPLVTFAKVVSIVIWLLSQLLCTSILHFRSCFSNGTTWIYCKCIKKYGLDLLKPFFDLSFISSNEYFNHYQCTRILYELVELQLRYYDTKCSSA